MPYRVSYTIQTTESARHEVRARRILAACCALAILAAFLAPSPLWRYWHHVSSVSQVPPVTVVIHPVDRDHDDDLAPFVDRDHDGDFAMPSK